MIWCIPVPLINRITRIHHANPLSYSAKGEEPGQEYAEAGSIMQRARLLPAGDALGEPEQAGRVVLEDLGPDLGLDLE